MSDYNEVFNLNGLDVGTPTNTDPYDEVKPAIRQVKFLLKHLLGTMFDANGNLKPLSAEALSDGLISTKHLADGVVLEVKLGQGSVSQDKIKDNAVVESKLASNSVGIDKIKNGAVSVEKLHASFVLPADKIGDGISGGKIKDNTLSGVKLANDSLPAQKLQSVTPVKIDSGTGSAGYLLVTDANGAFKSVPVAGDVSVSGGGGVKITKVQGCLEIADKKTSGSTGGQYNGAGEWVKRSFSGITTVSFASVADSKITFNEIKSVSVDIAVCASGSTTHQARLVWTNGVATTIVIVGTSAEESTPSYIKGKIVSANTGWYEIQINGTWGASGANDFGKPVGKGEEVFLTGTVIEL